MSSSCPDIIFGDIDYKKLIFDYHSLIFMKRISSISINDWVLECKEEFREEDSDINEDGELLAQSIKRVSVRKRSSEDNILEEKYLYHTPDIRNSGKNDLAFLIDSDRNYVPNRLYSVYYIKSMTDVIKPLGILVNTDHVNLFRNDLASTEDEIKKIKSEIKKMVARTLCIWTYYNFDYEEISKGVSKTFFRCLLAYWDEIEDGFKFREEKEKKVDFDEVFGLFNYVLANRCTVENILKISSDKEIVQNFVVDKQGIEEYEKYIPGIEDPSIIEKTEKVYYETFEQNEVITYSEIIENGISEDVKNAYEKIRDSKCEALIHMLNWFGSVKEYIKFVILDGRRNSDDVSMEEVASFISKYKDTYNEDTTILQRILGRYKILTFFSETGKIKREKINFVDYLFAEENNDNEISNEIFSLYNEKYYMIRKRLREDSCLFNYSVPNGPSLRRWDGVCATRIISEKRTVQNVDKSKTGMLLEIIDRQNLYGFIRDISEEESYPIYYLLDRNSSRRFRIQRIDYKNRDVYCLKAFNLSRIIQQCSFGINELIRYQHVLDRISGSRYEGTDFYMTGSLRINVSEEIISVNKLAELTLWITKWLNKFGYENREAVYQGIDIGAVDISDSYNECGADYIEFVNNITKGAIKDIYLRRIDAENHGARTVAYIGAGKSLNIRIKKNSSFTNMHRVKIENDNSRLYVFYANQTKEQALSEVMEHLELGADITEQIKGYISVAEIGHSVSSYEYERKLIQDFGDADVFERFTNGKKIAEQRTVLTVRDKKKLFMARGSYNGLCPICGKSLLGEDNDLDSAVKKTYLYTIKLDDSSFFQSCCCSDCLAILRKTYMGAILEGNILKLKQTIVSGEKETVDNDIRISLSRINMALKGISI